LKNYNLVTFVISKKYSKFYIKSDNSSWVLDELSDEIKKSLKKNFTFNRANFLNIINHQFLFLINKYDLLRIKIKNNYVAVSYFHTDNANIKINNSIIKILKENKNVKCIQITNESTRRYLLKKGICKKKIFKIPIGIDLKKFPFIPFSRRTYFKKIKKLQDYYVIGSFQKDGIGWKDGKLPKKIKGPDIFIKILKELKKKINIYVILTGPARGYVKNKLDKLNIPYEHHYLKNYDEVTKYFKFIDAYIVSSRQEGGPRSILETMASGVPIFSTKVGQAPEIINNGFNGFLYEIDQVKTISRKIISVLKDKNRYRSIINNGRSTSKFYSHNALKKYWIRFFKALSNINDR